MLSIVTKNVSNFAILHKCTENKFEKYACLHQSTTTNHLPSSIHNQENPSKTENFKPKQIEDSTSIIFHKNSLLLHNLLINLSISLQYRVFFNNLERMIE